MEETASGVNPAPSTSMSTPIGPQAIVASRRRYSKFGDLLVTFAIASVGKSNDGRFYGATHSLLDQLVVALHVAVANSMARSGRIFQV